MKKGFDEYDDEFELEEPRAIKRVVKVKKPMRKSQQIATFEKEYIEFIKSLECKN